MTRRVVAFAGLFLLAYAAWVLYRTSELRTSATRACTSALEKAFVGKSVDVLGMRLLNLGSTEATQKALQTYMERIQKKSGEIRGISNVRVKMTSEKLDTYPTAKGMAYCVADIKLSQGTEVIAAVLTTNDANSWQLQMFVDDNEATPK